MAESSPSTRQVLTLTATIPAMGAAAVNSAGEFLPLGFDLSGIQFKSTCADYNARTLALKLQGSNASGSTPPTSAGDWLDITSATASFAANGTARAAGESAGVMPLGGYRWIRMVATPSGALAAEAAVVEAWIVAAGRSDSPDA